MNCGYCGKKIKGDEIHGVSYSRKRKGIFSIIDNHWIAANDAMVARFACYYDSDAAREFSAAQIEVISTLGRRDS